MRISNYLFIVLGELSVPLRAKAVLNKLPIPELFILMIHYPISVFDMVRLVTGLLKPPQLKVSRHRKSDLPSAELCLRGTCLSLLGNK